MKRACTQGSTPLVLFYLTFRVIILDGGSLVLFLALLLVMPCTRVSFPFFEECFGGELGLLLVPCSFWIDVSKVRCR
jgi:hypothetical protein